MSTPTVPEPEAPERDPVAEMKERMLADGWTPARLEAKRAAMREITRQYGGKHVGYRLTWDGDRLVEPVVVFVAADETEVFHRYRDLSPHEQAEVTVRYVSPCGQAMGY